LHVLRHLQFFAGRAGDVDHVARHGDDFVFANFGEDALDEFGVEGCFEFVVALDTFKFSVPRSQFSVMFCQTEIVRVGAQFFVAVFCDQKIVFQTQTSAARPVNAGFDRQHHPFLDCARAGLVRIRPLVGAGADTVADGVGGLSGYPPSAMRARMSLSSSGKLAPWRAKETPSLKTLSRKSSSL
jgi:hypothetical protein